MRNIYQTALDAKFHSIMEVIAKELGYASNLIGLTAEQANMVQEIAEQSIIDWAVTSRNQNPTRLPVTNLQHLMDEYCAIADHL